ncbi:hypothetical protein [Streptomyces sp. NP-1717]|uniref:hypothetical protein n=1 Tax=Streptomyces sp. NP-1717 TaxID=2704470 RepID=UPI001F5E209B|nr:hypothetical protein [Streptomyces sp. NP-1717]MCI3220855.1 hypothetical protein [Streptomyces sp. NP-1717]
MDMITAFLEAAGAPLTQRSPLRGAMRPGLRKSRSETTMIRRISDRRIPDGLSGGFHYKWVRHIVALLKSIEFILDIISSA